MAAGDVRKRSRTFEPTYDGAADDEGHSKGGHSLRKRARIDYTQEMIEDDLGLPTARNDLVVKQAFTPSSRGRKRKGGHDDSGDESEDTASNPKRSRLEKSPAPFRASAARRRNTSKKLSTDLSNIVDHPSDNEVQDTILVSVPAGPGASSEEGSDRAISDDMMLDQPYASPEMGPAHLSLTPGPEFEEPELPFENGTSIPGIVAPTITNEPETITPQDSRVQTTDTGRVNLSLQHPEAEASHQTPATEPSIEISRPATTPVPEPKLPVDTTAPEPLQDTLKPSGSPSSSRQESKPTGPARLKPLARIYNAETPFASRVKLTPYEDEDTTLPGPYTEWVYPTQTVKEEWVAVPTATPCNTPLERKPVEADWDMRRPLKTKEFFALYRKEKKRRQEKGEPAISMAAFNNECARRYRSAHALYPISATPSSTAGSTTSSTIVPGKSALPAIASTTEETPQGSQPADSRLPTAAPSPAAIEDTPAQDDAGEDEQYVDEVTQEQLKPTSPGAPVEVARNPRKQYLFPKIRDPNEFSEAFEGWQDFDTDRLYETVAAAVETLHAYQQEYHELKKLLDDEENAKRRQASDKTLVNWENRQKADEPLIPRRHFDDVVKGPAAFEVRGARAPKPYIDDPVLERQKEEDRVMAQAYGFKLNTHPTQVGRQNPEEQRWEMPENRLRKRTEKGAELAEENVVEGKRARKPRHVADQSKDPSRAGTPTGIAGFGPVRRQRRKAAAANTNGDEFEGSEQAQFTESFSESPRKGRAARARGMMLLDEQDPILPVAEADNNRTEDEEVEVDEKPKVPRRRGRAAANLLGPRTSVPAGFGGDVSKPKRVRGGKGQQGNYPMGPEITSSSFYSNVSTQPGSRPSTASSDGSSHTAETTESTYSLRDKRKRNFALENDPELETRPQRRGRGPAAPKQEAAEPKKRGPKKKEPAAQPPPPPPASAQLHPPPATSPPPLQPPLATKFYNNFVTGPMMVENGPQPVPTPTGPFLHTFNAAPAFLNGTPPPPPQPPSVKKPITKIKFTNHGPPSEVPSSRASTPANGSTSSKPGKRSRTKKASVTNDAQAGAAANGDGDLDKPYAEMTKSEKMSWSMRSK
jgi:hypothetical protein